MREKVADLLDIFYFLFKKVMSHHLYRYLAIGGICFFLNFLIFNTTYHYFFLINTNWLNRHTKALFCSMLITLPTGFILTKTYLFDSGKLNFITYFIKYSTTTIICVIATKLILDVFLLVFHWNVMFSYLIAIISVQTANFFVQRSIL